MAFAPSEPPPAGGPPRRAVSLAIDHVLDIDAPPGVVWDAITDLPAYGEWNPFVVACRSTLAVGDPITMRVRLFSWFAQTQRETVVEHVPGRRLCYGLDGGATGAIVSRRCHEVEAIGTSRTRYRSHFALSGWLAGLVRLLLGARLRRGFASMSAAIQVRAEAMRARKAT
jgi:hypothetical protein